MDVHHQAAGFDVGIRLKGVVLPGAAGLDPRAESASAAHRSPHLPIHVPKRPRFVAPELWAGWKPNGIGELKPNHYVEIAETIWDNRKALPYALRILRNGVCDGC